MKVLNAAVSLGLISVALGFQSRSSPLQRKTSLSVLPLEHLNDIHHHASLLTDSSAFAFLADAAAATVDAIDAIDTSAVSGAVVETEAKVGPLKSAWFAYIDLFKQALNAIHDTIDEPLNSVGIEQSWGISIALFTASE